jgi:NADH-quinone oxidoreductase subunit H
LPLVLAVVGVVIEAGTMNLQEIVYSQAEWRGLWGLFHWTQLPGLLIFLIAAQAELTQTPFDMPVAESELVAGYQTEYSGLAFLFFYIGEFGTAFGLSAIAATLFLGGWYFPGVPHDGILGGLIGVGVLFAKLMGVAFLIFWIRFTYPRFREDQLQAFAWKALIPLSLVFIAAAATLKVVF